MASFILVVVECKEQNKLEPKMEKMGLIYSMLWMICFSSHNAPLQLIWTLSYVYFHKECILLWRKLACAF